MYPDTKNKAFIGAYEKGRRAAKEGKPKESNPYGDARTDRGSVTFARAFWRYWGNGWEDGTDKMSVESILEEIGLPIDVDTYGYLLPRWCSVETRFRIERCGWYEGRSNKYRIVDVDSRKPLPVKIRTEKELKRALIEYLAVIDDQPRPEAKEGCIVYARRHSTRYGESVIWVQRKK